MDEQSFADLCVQAVRLAANDLALDPGALAEELAHGEIGLLARYLQQAAPHVPDLALREAVELLLHRLTAWTGRGG